MNKDKDQSEAKPLTAVEMKRRVMCKLTKCGCNDCEEKAAKLFEWVNEVMGRYPVTQRKRCAESLKIPSVPLRNA